MGDSNSSAGGLRNLAVILMAVGLLPFPGGVFHGTAQATGYSVSWDSAIYDNGLGRGGSAIEPTAVVFEENLGQADPSVQFLLRSDGMMWYFAKIETVLVIAPPNPPREEAASFDPELTDILPESTGDEPPTPAIAIRMRLFAGNSAAVVTGYDQAAGVTNYYLGDDSAKWITGARSFARIVYDEVYPGIDLEFYGSPDGRLEYDFTVAPGADPRLIGWKIEGASVSITDADGALALESGAGLITFEAPATYQMIAGEKRSIEGRYARDAEGTIRFDVDEYDRREPLVIDPVLIYSRPFGDTMYDDSRRIAIDTSGNAYIAGWTNSIHFPTVFGWNQVSWGGSFDASVTALTSTGTYLYRTYLGGTLDDGARGIAVDPSGNVYFTGHTHSTNFPFLGPGEDDFGGGTWDGFIAKLSPQIGMLLWSSYLGGAGNERGQAVAVRQNDVYVTGDTTSSKFLIPYVPLPTNHGLGDVFLAKFTSVGVISWYTFLGGTGFDGPWDIAVWPGAIYISGISSSLTFSGLGAPKSSYGGGTSDPFVIRIPIPTAGIPSPVWYTYLGGPGIDGAYGVRVRQNDVYVVGESHSNPFPTTPPATTNQGFSDAFVVKLFAPSGAMVWSHTMGGAGNDMATDVAVGPAGVYISGNTVSANPAFATPHAYQASNLGSGDAFVAKFSSAGALVYSTYLGGAGMDDAWGIAWDPTGIYLSGYSESAGFPIAGSIPNNVFHGARDGFATKLILDFKPCDRNQDGNVDLIEKRFCPDGDGSPPKSLTAPTIRPADEIQTRIDSSGIWSLLDGAVSSRAIQQFNDAAVSLNIARPGQPDLTYSAVVKDFRVVSVSSFSAPGSAYVLSMSETAALAIVNSFDRARTATLLFNEGFIAVNGATQADKIVLKGISSRAGASILKAEPYAVGSMVALGDAVKPLAAAGAGNPGLFKVTFGETTYLVDRFGGRVGHQAKVILHSPPPFQMSLDAKSGSTTNSKQARVAFAGGDAELGSVALAVAEMLEGVAGGDETELRSNFVGVWPAGLTGMSGASTQPASPSLPCVPEERGTAGIFDRWGQMKPNGFVLGAASTETVRTKLCGIGMVPAPVGKGGR